MIAGQSRLLPARVRAVMLEMASQGVFRKKRAIDSSVRISYIPHDDFQETFTLSMCNCLQALMCLLTPDRTFSLPTSLAS